jgi:hypothetical protein
MIFFFFKYLLEIFLGGWLATLSLLLNALARGVQLFSKPKKSPETLKLLLNQLMANRQQQKIEKEGSEYGSQISAVSREKNRSQVNFKFIFLFLFHHSFFSLYLDIQWIICLIDNFLLNFIHIIILQFLNIVK